MEMEKKKIGSDVDEVVTEYLDSFIEFYNREYHQGLRKQDIDFYDLSHALNISKKRMKELIAEFESHPDFDEIRPVKGSVQCLRHLSETHLPYFITSRRLGLRDKTETFLSSHLAGIDFETYFSGELYPDQGKRKAEICKELRIPILLEDSAKYALECANAGIKVILFNRRWNKGFQHANVTRVLGWGEVPKVVLSLERRLSCSSTSKR